MGRGHPIDPFSIDPFPSLTLERGPFIMPGYHALASPLAAAAPSLATSAVSTGVALACLVAAGLLWFVGGHLPRVTLLLVVTASIGLASTAAGSAIHNAVASLVSQANAQAVSLAGAGISGLIGLVLGYVLYIHWAQRNITYTTLASGALLPMVAAATPGLGGRVLMWALGLCASLITGVAHMIGVH
jgi:hypothetical protein